MRKASRSGARSLLLFEHWDVSPNGCVRCSLFVLWGVGINIATSRSPVQGVLSDVYEYEFEIIKTEGPVPQLFPMPYEKRGKVTVWRILHNEGS